MLEGFECERCGHRWIPRATTEDTPTICPKCKSPYWNKPRLNAKIQNPKVKQPRIEVDKFKNVRT
jgi:predicted Zn-ribbon and HTH transcriptional regulator